MKKIMSTIFISFLGFGYATFAQGSTIMSCPEPGVNPPGFNNEMSTVGKHFHVVAITLQQTKVICGYQGPGGVAAKTLFASNIVPVENNGNWGTFFESEKEYYCLSNSASSCQFKIQGNPIFEKKNQS